MRKGELLFNYAVMLGPMVVGLGIAWAMSLTYSMPRATFWAVIVFYFVGFALFAKAKYSVIRQGHLFTFGSSQMSKNNRIAYYLGYGGMTIGFVLLIGYFLAVQQIHG